MLSDTDRRTFTLELSPAGRDTQIAAAGGAVGLYEARELERAIVSEIGQGRTRVVVDVTEVIEVGPGLLGVLLRLRRGVLRQARRRVPRRWRRSTSS